MNIAIYRSQDKKIIINSMFSERLANLIESKHNVEMVMDSDIPICLTKIKESDLIIIFSHGSEQGIFHRYENDLGSERKRVEWLFGTRSNLNYLAGKKVIVFSCFTAMYEGVGELAVRENNCITYLGFQSSINRELPDDFLELLPKNDKLTKNFISVVYSSVFENTLAQAFDKNLTFKQFAQLTKIMLKKEIMNKINRDYGRTIHLSLHLKGAIPVYETADSIHIHGNEEVKFCS
ncbi:hypothetical protein ABIC22_001043 [Paenibacillus sp. PvP094]|uniref:hypothetical protein n=1 Tax=Paenibacillus sp. PvP094 TaxID=3156394 RepID=UPI003395D3E9